MRCHILDLRKVAAVDIAFPGPPPVIAEFVAGVVGSLAVGVVVALRSRSATGLVPAAYLLSLGVNYVPRVLHAVSIRHARSAPAEIADEVTPEPRRSMREYRRSALLLLLAPVGPVRAVVQERRRM